MNRTLRCLVAGGFIAAASAVSAGCVDNNSTLFIVGVLYRKAPACTVSNDANNTYLLSGQLDLAFSKSYQATVLVGNQYTTRGSKQNLRVETTRVALTGAEVTLKDSDGNPIGSPFSVYGSGFVDSSKGEDPGYGLFNADFIPQSIGDQLVAKIGTNRKIKTQVVATVRVFGDTLGGQSITSGPLSFPIDVCYGCLVNFPLEAVSGANKCVVKTTETPAVGCHFGQDDTIDCRSCAVAYANVCGQVPPS